MRDHMHGVGNSRGSYMHPARWLIHVHVLYGGEVRPRMVPGYAIRDIVIKGLINRASCDVRTKNNVVDKSRISNRDLFLTRPALVVRIYYYL